jgi:hypothetical protein
MQYNTISFISSRKESNNYNTSSSELLKQHKNMHIQTIKTKHAHNNSKKHCQI